MAEPRDDLDRQILALHAQGLTDAEISRQLGRPARTIGYRLTKRLGLKSHTRTNSRDRVVEQFKTTSAFSVQDLDIDRISADAATQMRIRLSPQTIREYADVMEEGEIFPPIVVFQENETYWTADGWHRVEAAKQLGLATIRGEVRSGGLDDAIDFACSANTRHGLRPTIEDRRKAVMTQLRRHPERSDREIARLCGCSHSTVGLYRAELESAPGSPTGGRTTAQAAKPASDEIVDHSPSSGQTTTLPANQEPEEAASKAGLDPERKAAALERLKQQWTEINERERQEWEALDDDADDGIEAELIPHQVPMALRRVLTSEELEAAARALAQGEPPARVATGLGVMRYVLMTQVIQMAWRAWCEAHDLPPHDLPV
jgi:ParB-like nuclease domain